MINLKNGENFNFLTRTATAKWMPEFDSLAKNYLMFQKSGKLIQQ